MFNPHQIVWNDKDKKPEVFDLIDLGPDTYISSFFGCAFPKYRQTHFVIASNEKTIYCPESLEEAQKMIDSGEIKPSPKPKSHTQCCGVWDDGREHTFWCSEKPSKKRDDILLHTDVESDKLIDYNKEVAKERKKFEKRKLPKGLPQTLKGRAVILCKLNAGEEISLDKKVIEAIRSELHSVVHDAYNEAKKRNPDLDWIHFGDHGSYEAYHRIRNERPELGWREIWDYFKAMHNPKRLWEIAAQLIQDDYKQLDEYPEGRYGNGLVNLKKYKRSDYPGF